MSGSRKSQGRHGIDPYWREDEESPHCWLWLWGKQHGYAQITFNGKIHKVHRLMYESQVGPIPDGMWILHHCGNRGCVRPDHLYAGTAKQNSDDMALHGTRYRGGRAKLPDEVVHAIRILAPRLSQGWQKHMAEILGVSPSTISNISTGKNRPKVAPGLIPSPTPPAEQRGTPRHKERRLTPEQAAEIKQGYTGRTGEQLEIAKAYGVTYGSISAILTGRSHPNVLPHLSGSMLQYRARHRYGR